MCQAPRPIAVGLASAIVDKFLDAEFQQIYFVRLMCIADLDTIILELYFSVWPEGTKEICMQSPC